MNNFQSLYQWEDYFHNPSGSLLGVLSAMQVIYSRLTDEKLAEACIEHRFSRSLPVRALSFGWYWAACNHLSGRYHHSGWCGRPVRFNEHWNVHRGTVCTYIRESD